LPWIIGGIVASVLIIMAGIVLVSNNLSRPGTTITNPGSSTQPTTAPVAPGSDPPRMSLETFKKLYDDPAQRPMIIDVRAVESYQAGHIKGSISFPESDVDARVSEIPKDKLVIAYCQ
jgi:3-mercaptopyruvate sulfurtransferase SseA